MNKKHQVPNEMPIIYARHANSDTPELKESLKQRKASSPRVYAGATWENGTLTLTIDRADNADVSVIFDGTEYCLGATENTLALPFSDPTDTAPIYIKAENGDSVSELSGGIRILDINKFFSFDSSSEGLFSRRSINNCADPKLDISAADAGIEENNGILRFFDRYGKTDGSNFPFIHEIASADNIPELEDSERDLICSFDLKINAMPSSTYCHSAMDGSYGFSAVICRGGMKEGVYFGVQNLDSVLTLFISNCGGKKVAYAPLDKKIGDSMKISAIRKKNNGLDVYVDGRLALSELECVHRRRRFSGVNALTFMWLRTRVAPESHEDDMDIEVSSLSLGQILSSKNAVLTIENDLYPFKSGGKKPLPYFALDTNRNSIIADMGRVTAINRAVLHTLGNVNMINKSFISLYASDDNKNYEYIKDYSLLINGQDIYFYNFSVKARYLKINSTHNDAYDRVGRICGNPALMLSAEYTDSPLLSFGKWEHETHFALTNSKDGEAYDTVHSVTLSELGISKEDLKPDMSDIRFILGDIQIPQYRHGDTFYLRIPHLDARDCVSVKVLYGNANALSVSDGNEVFEVTYGARFAEKRVKDAGYWMDTVAEMPNGELLKTADIWKDGVGYFGTSRSTDGGHTWSELEKVEASAGISSGGGFIVDKKAGKVFYLCYKFRLQHPYMCKYYIFESDDSGYTWTGPVHPENAPEYAISYSDGITLSDADGDGPNVDYVFTTGMMRNLSNMAFSTTGFYSADGGKTWRFSDSVINVDTGDNDFAEGGLSEETVWEKKDGSLLLYARCQIDEITHFAKSHSYDRGVTWENVGKDSFSNIFTSNTQPIIVPMGELPVLMWAGNNSLGGRTYQRHPLNMAVSYDDGETFRDIVGIDFATAIATADRSIGDALHTNPDTAIYEKDGVTQAYVISTRYTMHITDVENFLLKTKGAFDSFEDGYAADGWLVSYGKATVTSVGATDGKYALDIVKNSLLSRTLHYMESGSVSFDLTPLSLGEGFAVELQTAFNNEQAKTAPIIFGADGDGRLFYSDKEKGKVYLPKYVSENKTCEIGIIFDCAKKTATLTVDGESFDIGYDSRFDAISYVGIFTGDFTDIAIDRFIAIREDQIKRR